MKHGVFSIKDLALGAYAAPFIQANNNVAMRAFGDLANDQKTNIYQHPSDFCLVRLGTFDDDTGKFESEDPTTLAYAADFQNDETNT